MKINVTLPILLALALIHLTGCQLDGKPRPRLGSYATSTVGTNFLGPDKLGHHSYAYSPLEKNGIVYTCKAGHIDITHLRIAADHTRYLSDTIYEMLMENETDLTFDLRVEPSQHHVHIEYPPYWDNMTGSVKKDAAREMSYQVGQYLTFNATTWHEIIVWFGFKSMAFVPEFPSAFSWEDVYSNLLGTHIAVKAMRDTKHSYNKAMTIALNEEMQKLKIQPAAVARQASENVRGKWFTGELLVDMKRRNFDIGLDDGFVTPAVVDGICDGETIRLSPVPTLNWIERNGFKITQTIAPKEWETKKILQIASPDESITEINPAKHFPAIMDYLEDQAAELGYNF